MKADTKGVMLVSLSMYDWPETRSATDAYWRALRDSLANYGFAAPSGLTRDSDPHACWRAPDLLLAQTCGLPYVAQLRGRVSIVGTPGYDIDCGCGSYFSVLVVREAETAADLSAFAGECYAYSDRLSQSGFAAFHQAMRRAGHDPQRWKAAIRTGSHRESIRKVAGGAADIAAIDAVSWQLARRHEPAAAKLSVLGESPRTPGLPYITAIMERPRVERLHLAVVDAMASLDESVREDLLLTGFVPTTDKDYDIIAARWQALNEAGATALVS